MGREPLGVRSVPGTVLVPNLRFGDLVILDNLSSHKGVRASQLVRAMGAELVYLPALFAGSESDRAGVQQDQAGAAELCESETMADLWGCMQRVLESIPSLRRRRLTSNTVGTRYESTENALAMRISQPAPSDSAISSRIKGVVDGRRNLVFPRRRAIRFIVPRSYLGRSGFWATA